MATVPQLRVPAADFERFVKQNPGVTIMQPTPTSQRLHAKCEHSLQLKIVQKEGPNLGRPFWTCGSERGDCPGSFYGWADGRESAFKAGGGNDGGGTHVNYRPAAPAEPQIDGAMLLARLTAIEQNLAMLINSLAPPVPSAPAPVVFSVGAQATPVNMLPPKANLPSHVFAQAQKQAFGAAAASNDSQPMD